VGTLKKLDEQRDAFMGGILTRSESGYTFFRETLQVKFVEHQRPKDLCSVGCGAIEKGDRFLRRALIGVAQRSDEYRC